MDIDSSSAMNMDIDDEPSNRRSTRNPPRRNNTTYQFGTLEEEENRDSSDEEGNNEEEDSSDEDSSYSDSSADEDADNPFYTYTIDNDGIDIEECDNIQEDESNVPCDDDDKKMPSTTSSSQYIGEEQPFVGGNGTKYTATLLQENGVPFKANKAKSTERSCSAEYLCGGYKFGINCCGGSCIGANQWKIVKESEGRRSRRSDHGTTIIACALFGKMNGLKSDASNQVGEIIPCKNVELNEQPVIVRTEMQNIANDKLVNRPVPLMGGDVNLVHEAAKAGFKYLAHKMGDKDSLNDWIQHEELNGNVHEGVDHGLFLVASKTRGSENLKSNVGINRVCWDMMKETIKSQPRLNRFVEKYEKHNNISSCWLVQYARKQDDKPVGSKRKSAPKGGYKRQGNKKVKTSKQGGRKKGRGKRKRRGQKKWGRHKLHADGQYCGMSRAILSFGCKQKIMRIVDRETGRWFDVLIQHGTIIEMSRLAGGVNDKRWMHEVRNAQGSYTLVIEFSPKKN